MPNTLSGSNIFNGDLEIGAVELKDGLTDTRGTINAANTARTTATNVLVVQNVDAAGNVGSGGSAANTARTTATLVTPSQIVDAAGNVVNITAANTARTTGTLTLPVQPVDAAGNVLGRTAANTARTTGTLVDPVQVIDAAGNVVSVSAANTARTTGTMVTPVQQVAADGTVDKLTTLTTLTGGGIADNAADSGNPLKVGGKYTAAGVTLDDGDRGNLALDSKSNLQVNENTLHAGEDQTNDVQKIEGQFSYAYCTADTAVKAAAGFLHSLTFAQTDAAPTAGTIIVYDNTAESGTIVYSETFDTTIFRGYSVILDIKMTTGIYVGFTTTADVGCTVSYR